MKMTYGILATTLTFVLSVCAYAKTDTELSSERLISDAKAVSIEIFPHLCGSKGEYCGFVIDGRRECAREFVMNFPVSLHAPNASRGVLWVTLDDQRRIISVSLTKDGSCRDEWPRRVAS
ncbi:MAG: hypothetical protein ABI583_03405 [Betaproteobacteria bacterium]